MKQEKKKTAAAAVAREKTERTNQPTKRINKTLTFHGIFISFAVNVHREISSLRREIRCCLKNGERQ